MIAFYDRLASLDHLIFPDWKERIDRHAGQLTRIIYERWGGEPKTVLSVSCGIGTQACQLLPGPHRASRVPGGTVRE
jgi:hypothetical protein